MTRILLRVAIIHLPLVIIAAVLSRQLFCLLARIHQMCLPEMFTLFIAQLTYQVVFTLVAGIAVSTITAIMYSFLTLAGDDIFVSTIFYAFS
jgi:hypothetical protein